MFRAAHRPSSGALTVFAAFGLHTHVVTGCSQVWVGTGQFPLRLDYGRSPHAYVKQRLQIQLELLMMSGMLLETCWAFNERWINEFYYKVASCWLFLLNANKVLYALKIIPEYKPTAYTDIYIYIYIYNLPSETCITGGQHDKSRSHWKKVFINFHGTHKADFIVQRTNRTIIYFCSKGEIS